MMQLPYVSSYREIPKGISDGKGQIDFLGIFSKSVDIIYLVKMKARVEHLSMFGMTGFKAVFQGACNCFSKATAPIFPQHPL